MKTKLAKRKLRNLLHNHPLLRKGGRHEKTGKTKRRLNKMALKKEWLPRRAFAQALFGEFTRVIFGQINRVCPQWHLLNAMSTDL